VPLGYDPRGLDAILLTHAHLDHCGLVPLVVREGFRGPIRATAATIELARLVLEDSGRLQEEFARREARWERRNPERAAADDARDLRRLEAALDEAAAGDRLPEAAALAGADADGAREPTAGAEPAAPDVEAVWSSETGWSEQVIEARRAEAADGTWDRRALPREPARVEPRPPAEALRVDLDAPLYTEAHAIEALRRFRPIPYDAEEEVAPGIHATFLDAGHILGSSIIRLRVVEEPGGPERVLVFSGDLGKRNTSIIRDPTIVRDADYVLVESTYGGREHEPEAEARRVLAEIVRLVAANRGVLLVPSFAIGRTQELIWSLDRLVSAGEIPALPLYLDSPMAREATSVYRRHTECYDEETRRLLEAGDTPLDYPRQRVVRSVEESEAIARAPRPHMIVASNGMLTGGRVLGHLARLVDDPGAVLLFVGYQGEGTLGRRLQEGARRVRILGQEREVRCQVRSVSGFSAHADEPELLDWIGGFVAGRRPGDPGVPRRVFLVHGDPGPQAALVPKVEALGLAVHGPRWHETVTLD
jgi:metallo-beta-lactamase family protein